MSIADLFSPELLGLFITILVAFGTAMVWLGATTTKLSRLDKDVESLQKSLKNLEILLKVDILVKRALEEHEKQQLLDKRDEKE